MKYLLKQIPSPPPRDFDSMHDIIKETETTASKITGRDNQTWYVLKGKSDNLAVPWAVLVNDLVTALHCLRKSPGPQTTDIMTYFLCHGISFHTILLSSFNVKLMPPHTRCLGW